MEGQGNYTLIHLRDGQKILTSKTLKLFDGLVPSGSFWRINKTYIIRPEQITHWHDSAQKHLCVTLASGHTCEVSRRRRPSIKRYLKSAQAKSPN
jgi:two-component system, LytTR family, response regulator